MGKEVELVRHISLEELRVLIRKEKDKHLHERLLFIYQLYLGDTIQQAYTRLCIAEQTAYNWLKRWNKHGYEGVGPQFNGGRHARLTLQQQEELQKHLKQEKHNWVTAEVRAHIKRMFHVTYSERHVARMLRTFGMYYAKPYPRDYRQPDNAEELLQERIEQALEEISTPSDAVVGFLDEASPQTTDNKQRFWSFIKPQTVKNTEKYRANTFGFYPINGKAVVAFKERSTIAYVCEFLRQIRDRNPGKRIILFLDNARAHIARKTKEFAQFLKITLVFLPTYSPKLNPIEFIWKSVRRKISQIFVKSAWSFKETICSAFHRLAKKRSFQKSWIQKFGGLFPNLLCP